MISYLQGQLAERGADYIVIDVGGIGFTVFTPGQAIDQMPSTGETVKVYTYFQVKEDSMTLYGFLRHDDLEMFKMLIGVSGIGPKGALAILSVLSSDDVRFAILSGDVKSICRAPGVGKKMAERVIFDLKDKLSIEDAFEKKLEHNNNDKGSLEGLEQTRQDALLALTALGFSQAEALRAVRSVELSDGMQVDEVLQEALKNLL